MKPLEGEDDGWLLIGVEDKNYVPVIDSNLEEFKHKETLIKFEIRKKWGPVSYEEEQSTGMILDMYLPTYFMEEFKIIKMIIWRRGGYWNQIFKFGTRNICLRPLILNNLIIC